jgi:thymidylate synthase ThyX
MIEFLALHHPRVEEQIKNVYTHAIDQGVPHEEARQILPNAMAVNILLTVNARSLMNIFNLRLCNRNTDEMRIIAYKMWRLVDNVWGAYAFECGPDCVVAVDEHCSQGTMRCHERYFKELA